MTRHSSDNNKFRLELLEGYLRLLRFVLFIGRSETLGVKKICGARDKCMLFLPVVQ